MLASSDIQFFSYRNQAYVDVCSLEAAQAVHYIYLQSASHELLCPSVLQIYAAGLYRS